MRLIDADALGICKANPAAFEEKEYAWGWNTAIEIIENAPTVDAVPVVRCGECDYHHENEGFHFCKRMGVHCPDDSEFFCGYAKRRDNNDGQIFSRS